MRIGVAKEIEDNGNRVGLTAEGAAELVAAGHDVSVERRWCMNQKYGSGSSLPQGSSSIADRKGLWRAERSHSIQDVAGDDCFGLL